MTDKKIIPPELVVKHLELLAVKRRGQVADTLADMDTLQESHKQASQHLWKLQDEVAQIEQAIRLLQ